MRAATSGLPARVASRTALWTAVTVSAALAVVDHPGLFYPIMMGYAAAVVAYLMWRRSRRP